MAEPVFKVINVTKIYGKHLILEGINFDVKRGEILGIIGPSGSGKTTLLNTIIGFIKPDEGDVLFRIEHLLNYQKAVTFRSVFRKFGTVKSIYGFASQVPSFYPNLTVEENLRYFGSLYNLSKDTIESNIKTLLYLLDLKEARKVRAKSLSGGMERRLDIACAMIHDPDVLILDEPTADLDPLLTNNLLELIRKINRKGTTIVLSSHNINEMEHLCHRIAILKDHKILDLATPEELKQKFANKQEIHLESYPGDYAEITKRLKPRHGVHCERLGNELVIKTPKTQETLHELFHHTEQMKENIIDLRISNASLHDIFLEMTEKSAGERIDENLAENLIKEDHTSKRHGHSRKDPEEEEKS